ncbi:DUF7344 domain-containing protein [Natronoarchaeum rubrum]|uniref:DUF7344 domain-containing protein n=1 Tax=Natronoarchaeum rubrum TaxID=755311 RepID=UPI002110F40E|nr:hypothetical protein [Natronoarchaeum rubrum]
MGRDAPTFDDVLDLCADRRRRIVLGVLVTQERSLTINDLTKAIVKHNHHEPLAEVSGETLTQIKAELHHRHAPRLADAGLIKYDRERQLVEPTDRFAQVETQLTEVLDADPAAAPPLDL